MPSIIKNQCIRERTLVSLGLLSELGQIDGIFVTHFGGLKVCMAKIVSNTFSVTVEAVAAKSFRQKLPLSSQIEQELRCGMKTGYGIIGMVVRASMRLVDLMS